MDRSSFGIWVCAPSRMFLFGFCFSQLWIYHPTTSYIISWWPIIIFQPLVVILYLFSLAWKTRTLLSTLPSHLQVMKSRYAFLIQSNRNITSIERRSFPIGHNSAFIGFPIREMKKNRCSKTPDRNCAETEHILAACLFIFKNGDQWTSYFSRIVRTVRTFKKSE